MKGIGWPHVACIIVVAVLVYGNTLGAGFVWDDLVFTQGKSLTHDLSNIPRFFTTDISSGTNLGHATPYYRPFGMVFGALEYAICGQSPFGYHLINLALHCAIAVLVLAVSFLLLQDTAVSLAAALIYTVHPVHAESVAYISSGGELLYTLLYLAALAIYIRWRDTLLVVRGGVVTLLFVAALLVKESAITFPLLIVSLELVFPATKSLRRFGWSAFFVAVTCLYMAIRMHFVKAVSWMECPLPDRFFTSCGLLIRYLQNIFFPADLKVLYDVPLKVSFFRSDVVVPFCLLLLIGAVLSRGYNKDRPLLFWGAWFFITISPASGIPAILHPALMADRYLCLPLVGCAVVGGLFRQRVMSHVETVKRPGDVAKLLHLCGLVVLGLLAVMTVQRNRIWHDHRTFVQTMIHDAPDHSLGYEHRGNTESKAGNYTEMARYYFIAHEKDALKLRRYGSAYLVANRAADAKRVYNEALNLFPDDVEALNGYGVACLKGNNADEAIAYFSAALAAQPGNREIRMNLQTALRMQAPTSR